MWANVHGGIKKSINIYLECKEGHDYPKLTAKNAKKNPYKQLPWKLCRKNQFMLGKYSYE